jgi:hypothetical protein
MSLGVGLLLRLAAEGVLEQLGAGEQEDRAEDQEDEVERRQRGGAEGDEDAAQHQRADDAEQQHALLQHLRHRERREQQHEDEQVVDAERLLDDVAGVVVDAALTAVGGEHVDAEGERQRDVEDRPEGRLLHRHLVRLAGGDEVDDQQADDGGDRDRPQGRRTDGVEAATGVGRGER